jgi:tellurite resistance protein TerC
VTGDISAATTGNSDARCGVELLLILFLGKPLWMWLLFMALIIGLLAFDLGVLNRTDHVIGIGESLALSALYISLGLAFSGFIWWQMGGAATAQYLTAFVVEKTLAMDNIFVIALIFSYFAIPPQYQHRVLFWGIIGVIVLRGIMIGLGATIVAHYHWVLYLFAAFLMVTGVKMLFASDETPDLSRNRLISFLKNRLPVTDSLHGHDFIARLPREEGGKKALYATPLLFALVLIELADVLFAVDSVPAVFTITTDPFLAYTSNIFAILGLRALYFALSAILRRFAYLKYALSALLVFIGSKIFIAKALGWPKFPPEYSLAITLAILATGILASLLLTREKRNPAE